MRQGGLSITKAVFYVGGSTPIFASGEFFQMGHPKSSKDCQETYHLGIVYLVYGTHLWWYWGENPWFWCSPLAQFPNSSNMSWPVKPIWGKWEGRSAAVLKPVRKPGDWTTTWSVEPLEIPRFPMAWYDVGWCWVIDFPNMDYKWVIRIPRLTLAK